MTATSFPQRIAYHDAHAILLREAAARQCQTEAISLGSAHGHVLGEDIVATVALPGFDNAAMDGFALRHADLSDHGETRLRLAGEQFAGGPAAPAVGAGQCIRITTGAPMPAGADTVVMKENTRQEGDTIVVLQPSEPGRHVRRLGEDVSPGDVLLRRGDLLTPSRIALAATQGLAQLHVGRKPTVAVFATGDELVEPGLPLPPGRIYNSNRDLLLGLLREDGIEAVAWPTLEDTPARIESALRHAGEAFDLVLTCGGVSAGEKDHLPELLQRRGRVHFWRVRMKPGMPALFADGGTLGPALFLCLPGNPVSVLATYLALARPLLDGLQGRKPRPVWHARLAAPWHKRHERLEFLRGRLLPGEDGTLRVEPNPADGSHRIRAAADSDVLIRLEEGARMYPEGTPVAIQPY